MPTDVAGWQSPAGARPGLNTQYWGGDQKRTKEQEKRYTRVRSGFQ